MMRFFAAFLIVFTASLATASAQNKITFHDIKHGMKDEWVEQLAIKAATERGTNVHWLVDYKKAKIISQEYELVRDGEGNLLGRVINVELYCVKPNGDCAMADFVFKQKYKDEHYVNHLTAIHVGSFINIDCE